MGAQREKQAKLAKPESRRSRPAPDMHTLRNSEEAARQLLRDGGWSETKINACDIREVQQGLSNAVAMVESANGDFSVADGREQRISNKAFILTARFPPPSRIEHTDSNVISSMMSPIIIFLARPESLLPGRKPLKCVGTEDMQLLQEIILLPRLEYFRLSGEGLDDERTAPAPKVDPKALALFLDILSLIHI